MELSYGNDYELKVYIRFGVGLLFTLLGCFSDIKLKLVVSQMLVMGHVCCKFVFFILWAWSRMRPENGCPRHQYFADVDSLSGDFTSFLRVNSVVIGSYLI